jgi:hypothetical protein
VTPESLFERFFLPLYPADARADLAAARKTDANPAGNPSIFRHLREAAEIFANKNALDFSDASVHRLSATIDAAKRDEWASRENELFNVVVHGSAYLGECIVRNHGGVWSARRPLWESVVRLKSRAVEADLAVFHWWLKALCERGSLADRYRALVEIPCARVEDLPVIAPPDRALPRITKVRYDVFYKYLRAHLPELKDVGEHFPSPERFDAYRFKWLQPMLLGEGRMLLLWGPGEGGVHLFWLTKEGFEKAALYPADAFPEPLVRAEDDKLVVITSLDKKPVTHEVMWWGP